MNKIITTPSAQKALESLTAKYGDKFTSMYQLDALTGGMTLDLADSSFEEIPCEVWQLTQLVSLNIQDFGLTELPKEIGRLTALVKALHH